MINNVLAIIPARGKSKGLPRKNIIDVAGKPLIAWTIEASLNSKCISKTIVSSEDLEILGISLEYGAEIIKRPDNLARDDSTSESVVMHALDYLESLGEIFHYIILLQPTSPLRTSKDIDSAFKIMSESNAKAVISVYEFDNKILKTLTKNSAGFLESIVNNKYPFMRRQDLPKVYMPNGAIYIINIKAFLERNSFLTEKTVNYLMPQEKSVDIDSFDDIEIIQKSLRNK